MHGPDLTGIAIVAVAATLCGMLMVRVRQPPIVGYILAGVILGPSGLALVENRESINLLAELGVIMLLYFVGMELSLRAFRHIWKLALVTSLTQIVASVAVVYGIAVFFGWPPEWAILFGFCLALSSTAVAINVLDEADALRSSVGKVAVGVLIAQDLAVAPMLVIISNLQGGEFNPMVFVEVALSIGILLGFILLLTRRSKINLPFHRLTMGNPALTPLAALTWCFAFATVAGVLGMSPAFGAFLAGLVVGNSGQRHAVHENAVPVQAVLMMVFFLSIGLLIDLEFVWENLGLLMALWASATLFKTALNTGLLRVQGQSWVNAFSVSLTIGQLGEFSFLLAAAGLSAAVIDAEIHRLIVALTVISLMMSPLYTDLMHRLRHRAAGNIGSFGGLLKFAYVREWRVTKQASRTVVALAFRLATWMQLSVENRRAQVRAWEDARRRRRLRESSERGHVPDPSPPDAEFDGSPAERRVRPPKQRSARAKLARKAATKKGGAKKTGAKKTGAKKAAPKKSATKTPPGAASDADPGTRGEG